jgi:uncharacterized protein
MTRPTQKKGDCMRIGILSDTHNQVTRTAAAVAMLRDEGAAALVHCGDLTGTEIVAACGVLPAYFVFGNNDADSVLALRRAIGEVEGVCLEWGGELTLADKRIAVVHGHLHTEVRKLLAGQPDYLLSGHSHRASDTCVGLTRWINPGALHRATEFTVALLDLERDALRFLAVPR